MLAYYERVTLLEMLALPAIGAAIAGVWLLLVFVRSRRGDGPQDRD